MVMLPNEAYSEFSKIWEKEFGEQLSPTQARLKADKLMELFRKVIFANEGDKDND